MNLIIMLNLSLIVFYSAMLTYFEEFLTARHPLFKKDLRIGIVQEFGKSKIYYRSKAMREFYTVVKYCNNDEEHMVKISRSRDDCIGKEVILAVGKDNTAVRYGKCKWYNEEGESSSEIILVIMAFAFLIFNVIIVYFNEIKRVYSIFLPFMVIHYLLIPFIIRIRNSNWKLN